MIRWRRGSDEDAIMQLVRKELVPISRFPGIRSRHLRKDIARRLQRGHTLVAADSLRGKPFGFVHMEIHGPVLFIDLLAVDSAKQNRKWGTYLMKAAEAFGTAIGCTEARLFVDDTNVRGLRFYQKLGYSVIWHISAGSCYDMGKPLSGQFYPFMQ
jgi:ribosomal protein S18 acetylase RimI-like enzyme